MGREGSSLVHSSFGTGDTDVEDIRQKPAKKANASTGKMERQQRYREKQWLLANHLESSVKQLREEVDQQLIAYRDAQSYKIHIDVNMSATKVVAVMGECMKVFASGVQSEQTTFLESAMRSDVQYGDLVGRDNSLQHWVCFMRCFNDAVAMDQCEFSVKLLEQDIAVGLVGTMLTVRLTHRNLASAFPNAVTDICLRNKLLQGSLLRLPLTVLFEFDDRGKISCYDPFIDFVDGLYAVFRSYEDVVNVLDSGNIDTSGQIRGYRPSVATNRIVTSSGIDSRGQSESSSNSDKLSVAFLLSTSEDTRCTDTAL